MFLYRFAFFLLIPFGSEKNIKGSKNAIGFTPLVRRQVAVVRLLSNFVFSNISFLCFE